METKTITITNTKTKTKTQTQTITLTKTHKQIRLTNLFMKKILTIIAALFTIAANAQQPITLGGDISLVPAYENAGTKHKDAKGAVIGDLIKYLNVNAGMTSMRVRLFVNPTKKGPDGKSDPAVQQDLNYVQKLGRRIKDAGLKFMLDFHYSDTWADPSNQIIPAAWKKDTSDKALSDSVYAYTKRCLEYLKSNGATPDYIQVGNEISYGMLKRNSNDGIYTNQSATSSQWKRFYSFLNSGAKAIREITPNAQIIIHIERSNDADYSKKFYQYLNQNNVDYDIIGLSYYPFWHGYLTDLSKTLNTLQSAFPNTPVQIVETAYNHNWFPSDAKYKTTGTWAASEDGQAKFVKELIAELQKHSNVNALYYWCPEEAGNGDNNSVMNAWMNRGLWWEDSQWPLTKVFEAFKNYYVTDIPTITDNTNSSSDIYDLSGRKINKAVKGFYIKGGKKYLLK